MHRYLEKQVLADLKKKMVFVGGPRQVGKTTLAKSFLQVDRGYLSWDIDEHRERILKKEFDVAPIWAFDEIHKYRRWRNYLKGLHDARKGKQQILVTGSARLDYYRFGGDSLQGRYHHLRMNPLSVAELGIRRPTDLLGLLRLGGFPEPFFSASEVQAKRWSREYRTRLIREEILGLEEIHDLGQLELLMVRLPELVGNPLSINGLREDLQTSHKTVSRWLDVLERMYAIFRVAPFGAPKIRAVKKERKHYHYDWTLVQGDAFRFENLVAMHLRKWVDFEVDTKGRELDLCYFRDVDGREVDFVITEDRKPIQAIECKWNDDQVGKGLSYFKARFADAATWQISAVGTKDYVTAEGIRVCPALRFLQELI